MWMRISWVRRFSFASTVQCQLLQAPALASARRTSPMTIGARLIRTLWSQTFLNLALVELLRNIARSHNRSVGEVAIAWTLRHPAVTGAIVGARNARQAEGVMRAGDLQLSDQQVTEIETFFAETAA
jgi:aryl-alcohol dehydrogenase-like predicted oxidoreductase